MAMSEYNYQPLDHPTIEIRLAILQPGTEADSIEIILQHTCLDQNLVYEALSYTWGDGSITTSISVDEKMFQVRKNLESALRHLRQVKECRILWIDAICIDQSNLQERNQQVGRMREIYQMAKRVLVWLGPRADDSDLAMDAIASQGVYKSYGELRFPSGSI
jgi:hypothetical protein